MGSSPGSVTHLQCDVGQVTPSLGTSVSHLPCLLRFKLFGVEIVSYSVCTAPKTVRLQSHFAFLGTTLIQIIS